MDRRQTRQFVSSYHAQCRDRLIQDYVSYYFQHDLLHPQNAIPQNPSRTALRINDVIPDQEYEQTIYYNQFMRAYGNYDEMGIYLKKEGTLVGSIGLARCKQEQRFTENDVRLVETLSRTLAHTLAIHTHADELQKERMLFAAHSQLSSIGIIIVEPPAHIRYVNPVAKDICAEWFLGKTYTNPVHAFIKQHVENNAFASPSSFSAPAATALSPPSQQEFAIYVQPSVSTPFSDHRTLPYAIYLIPKGTHSGMSATREQDQLPPLDANGKKSLRTCTARLYQSADCQRAAYQPEHGETTFAKYVQEVGRFEQDGAVL